VPDGTFARPELTTFARLHELGLEAVGQRLEPDRAVLACRVVEPDQWCRRRGCQGAARDTVMRRLPHEPFGWRPTTLLLHPLRACVATGHQQGRAATGEAVAAGPAAALEAIVVGHLTVARVAEALAVSWNTANDAVLAEGSGGIWLDMIIHDFDTIPWVTGQRVQSVWATGAVLDAPIHAEHGDIDTASAVLILESGAAATVSGLCRNGGGQDARLEVFGTLNSFGAGIDERTPMTSTEPGTTPPGPPYDQFIDRSRRVRSARLRGVRQPQPAA
jgi:hypothetical protein